MAKFGIGQAVRRVEDQRFLQGLGRYVDDISLPGLCHGVTVLSPHAHARIKRVAFVVAETLAQARDAAELVEVDYEPLPVVVNLEDAAKDGAAKVWDDNAQGNVGFRLMFGN